MTSELARHHAAIQALRQEIRYRAEITAHLRLLAAVIVPDHHQHFLEGFDILDSVAAVMSTALEDLRPQTQTG